MPVYEFACNECGKKLEMLVKLGDKKEPVCDMCRKPMKKVMSAPAFILKGSGWARDLYSRGSNVESKKEKKHNGS